MKDSQLLHILIPYTADRRDRLAAMVKSIQENTTIPYVLVTYENKYEGWPKALQNMMRCVHGIGIILESDTIVRPGCLDLLWKEFWRRFPHADGVIEPYNEFHNGTLIQHPMCHIEYLKRYINPAYFHQYADNEMSDMLKMHHEYYYCPEAILEHNHFLNGKAEKDEGYAATLDPEKAQRDRELYYSRKANNFK